MMRFIRWLLNGDGHSHKWELFEAIEVVDRGGITIAHLYVLRCSVCGNIKLKKLS
jgi:hypothetical protein